ncbi:MAG: hypothetical protein IV104_02165 [Acidovorax sp.]|nr:hypothetical protein [Acidovorax sp.]
MRYRQQYVVIQQAEPGLTLAAPADAVVAQAMAYSLPAGHVLTPENIHQLQAHKVQFIVVSAPDARTDVQVAQDLVNTQTQIQKVFAGADLSAPCLAILFEQVLAFRSA